MDRLGAPDMWLTRLVLQRGLALVYLVAFACALNQFRPLLGERGLLPTRRFCAAVPFRRAPSLFHVHYSDRLLAAVAWCGVAASTAALLGLLDRGPVALSMATTTLVWLLMWALYLSIVNVGQTFYGFGWESLLLEAGFLAVLLGPAPTRPPAALLWLFRWLVFRLEFGAGLIKLRGDQCWRDLSCLDYHHETQPMPNAFSWHFHNLPRPVHRFEVLGNHLAQVVAPFGLFLPQPVAGIAGLVIVVTQAWLVVSGNFSWLNVLTIVLAASAFDDAWLHHVVPVTAPANQVAFPPWLVALVLVLTATVAVLSWWPLRNMLSRRQLMNASFNSLHLVNTYGAFGSVTRVRKEVVVEGTLDPRITPETSWREYAFKGKPVDVRRRPPQVAPYHLRLDWMMWFAALSPLYAEGWFVPLLFRLLEGDPATLRLFRRDPFGGERPAFVRARIYRYRFTTRSERRSTGAWWSRELAGDFVRPIRLEHRAAPAARQGSGHDGA